jgi:hypothetical protein
MRAEKQIAILGLGEAWYKMEQEFRSGSIQETGDF